MKIIIGLSFGLLLVMTSSIFANAANTIDLTTGEPINSKQHAETELVWKDNHGYSVYIPKYWQCSENIISDWSCGGGYDSMMTLFYHDTKFTDPDLFNEREISVMTNEKISILSLNGQIKDKKSSNWYGTITQEYEVETDQMKHLYKFVVRNDGYVYYVLFSSPKNDFNQEEGKRVMDSFTVLSPDDAKTTTEPDTTSGGCLVTTATFGTEFAPQVQQLREIRDNVLFSTASGTAFMTEFNKFYYSFSPGVADLERQNPVFREMVKATIIPMLSTLSILQFAEIDSEQEMLGYGIGIIMLNVGMYFLIPTVIIIKVKQLKKNNLIF